MDTKTKMTLTMILTLALCQIYAGEKCTTPLKIKQPEIQLHHINQTLTDGEITVFPMKAEALIMTRSYWSSFCYNGGSLDPNTGCVINSKQLNPKRKEAIMWKEKEMCLVGNICRMEGPCWGSEAEKCKDIIPTTWVDERLHTDIGSRYMKFPYHTCVMSWECHIKKTTLSISFGGPGKLKKVYISTPEGGQAINENGFYEIGYPNNASLLVIDPIIPRIYKNKVNCIEIFDIICIVSDNIAGLRGKTYFIDRETFCGTNQNTKLCILGPIMRIYQNNIQERTIKELIPFKSPSISTIQAIQTDILATQYSLSYNNMKISSAIFQIQRTITNMIDSLRKIDDQLISTILGKDKPYNSRTHLLGDDLFQQCSVEREVELDSATCSSNFHYKSGRLVEGEQTSDGCYQYKSMGYQNISFFDDLIDEDIFIEKSEILPSHTDEDGWTWLVNNRVKSFDTFSQNTIKSIGGLQEGFLQLTSLRSSIIGWLNGLGSVVAWIALILHFVRRR
uniref:Hemagglutinin n=1 Tax=Hubei earwig virus 1 TaxID=1922890 RepID=A0A1L3KKH8_9VIRU|nr:hemagglutinin [Hubei earwig virus 1]